MYCVLNFDEKQFEALAANLFRNNVVYYRPTEFQSRRRSRYLRKAFYDLHEVPVLQGIMFIKAHSQLDLIRVSEGFGAQGLRRDAFGQPVAVSDREVDDFREQVAAYNEKVLRAHKHGEEVRPDYTRTFVSATAEVWAKVRKSLIRAEAA